MVFTVCLSVLVPVKMQAQVGIASDTTGFRTRYVPGAAMDTVTNFRGMPVQPAIRESAVKFQKNIWRCLDTRQIGNKAFITGSPAVLSYMFNLATTKLITYENADLDSILAVSEIKKRLLYTVHTQVYGGGSNQVADLKDTSYAKSITAKDIRRWYFSEAFYFDNTAGKMRTRLVAIAPVFAFQEQGSKEGPSKEAPLFWLSADAILPFLHTLPFKDPLNPAVGLFWDRMIGELQYFDTYVVKSVSEDMRMADKSASALQSLIQSENLKQDLFIFEHDLWEY